MEYLLICGIALIASLLTLFSGFGLGTLLLPAFAIFFPIEIAVMMTAIVHLTNNLFKLGLFRNKWVMPVAIKFGLPALVTAFLGSKLLFWLSKQEPLWSYHFLGYEFEIFPSKLIIGLLMILFAFMEGSVLSDKLKIPSQYLPVGGVLSGFFGGLSGHQGAFRSLFLLQCGLAKEQFIATGIVIACLVDASRLSIYFSSFKGFIGVGDITLLIAAILAAFLGAVIGRRWLKKVEMPFIRSLVSVLLIFIGLGLVVGLI